MNNFERKINLKFDIYALGYSAKPHVDVSLRGVFCKGSEELITDQFQG